jgi:hypothetical protein
VKRKLVVAGGGILAAALLGIGGWYVAHTRATEAELNRAIADYEKRNQPVDVTFNVTGPGHTPKEQTLYLSGSVPALGNWDAAGVPLTRTDDGRYTATVKGLQHSGEYAFKVGLEALSSDNGTCYIICCSLLEPRVDLQLPPRAQGPPTTQLASLITPQQAHPTLRPSNASPRARRLR